MTVLMTRRAALLGAMLAAPALSFASTVRAETAGRLVSANLRTAGQLAAAPPTLAVAGVRPANFLELRAKARWLTAFPAEPRDLEPIRDKTVPEVLATSKAALADQLGKPDAWAAELLDKLRLLQGVIDEPDLARRFRANIPTALADMRADREWERLVEIYDHLAADRAT